MSGDTTATPSARPPLPDRLSVDPRSPHHDAAVVEHDIGICFNGMERHDVEEYCLNKGWIKVPAGKTVDRKGRPFPVSGRQCQTRSRCFR